MYAAIPSLPHSPHNKLLKFTHNMIYGRQGVTGTGFSPRTSALPISVTAPVLHIIFHLRSDDAPYTSAIDIITDMSTTLLSL